MPTITYNCYDTDQQVDLHDHTSGETILDASLKNGIPHYHACNGNGRCTTCRVRILEGLHNITPRTQAEQIIAQKKNWPDDIRLACQTKILGDVTVQRLVVDTIDFDSISTDRQLSWKGLERTVIVMFCDIVDFTEFTAKHLPYDVVHLLNRYYRAVGEPVLANQGYIDKYMGDGFMALFGLENNNQVENALNAIRASLQMHARVKELNKCAMKNFAHEFKMRIGLHYGPVIVGEVGHSSQRQLTVLGDTVNVASRIESANKAFETSILASQELYDLIPEDIETGQVITTQLRGQNRLHTLYEILGFNKTPIKKIN